MSYCLQKAYIENGEEPQFKHLIKSLNIPGKSSSLFATPLEIVLEYLNCIPDVKGFIYENYTPSGTKDLVPHRMYFSDENGLRIDAIRTQIEDWKNSNLVTTNEYFILLACLIETISFYANVAGVYAAFYKKWDPRAVKRLIMRPIEIIPSTETHYVHYGNSLDLVNDINCKENKDIV